MRQSPEEQALGLRLQGTSPPGMERVTLEAASGFSTGGQEYSPNGGEKAFTQNWSRDPGFASLACDRSEVGRQCIHSERFFSGL